MSIHNIAYMYIQYNIIIQYTCEGSHGMGECCCRGDGEFRGLELGWFRSLVPMFMTYAAGRSGALQGFTGEDCTPRGKEEWNIFMTFHLPYKMAHKRRERTHMHGKQSCEVGVPVFVHGIAILTGGGGGIVFACSISG